jgi:uncharacterized protein (UPF0335 family)
MDKDLEILNRIEKVEKMCEEIKSINKEIIDLVGVEFSVKFYEQEELKDITENLFNEKW